MKGCGAVGLTRLGQARRGASGNGRSCPTFSLRGGSRPSDALLALALILLLPLLVTLAFSSSLVLVPTITGSMLGSSPAPPPSPLPRTSPAVAPPPPQRQLMPPETYSLPGLPPDAYAAILAAACGALLYLAIRRLRPSFRGRPSGTDPFDERIQLEDEREKVASILEDAAAGINAGSGYREAILRCYKQISGALEARSGVDGRALTAREFRSAISERLSFDSPHLSKVVALFEFARYSDEEVTEAQAEQASECLSVLSASLRQTPSLGGAGGT